MDDGTPRKRCITCEEEKPLSEFYLDRKSEPGKFRARCKRCLTSEANSRYADMTPEQKQHNNDLRRIRKANPQYLTRENALRQIRRMSNPDLHHEQNRRGELVRKYSTTIGQYEEMLLSQNGGCAICGKVEAIRRLAVDHCHKTGMVRGLLCSRCNRALGLLNDDTERIEAALRYLQRAAL